MRLLLLIHVLFARLGLVRLHAGDGQGAQRFGVIAYRLISTPSSHDPAAICWLLKIKAGIYNRRLSPSQMARINLSDLLAFAGNRPARAVHVALSLTVGVIVSDFKTKGSNRRIKAKSACPARGRYSGGGQQCKTHAQLQAISRQLAATACALRCRRRLG